jgi:hydroxymethylpyrimidine pyrophosphatase-like HAD family hydrolase
MLPLVDVIHGYADIHVESFPFSAIETFPEVDFYFVEIQVKSEGKAELLRWLGRERGVKPEDVVVFGDQNNDLSLMRVAGTSYAMANSFESCFEVAHEIIASNGEEAVADKCAELFL